MAEVFMIFAELPFTTFIRQPLRSAALILLPKS
jgi:hypothetical protein